jgi:predicted XRE-type DNA-binding protein
MQEEPMKEGHQSTALEVIRTRVSFLQRKNLKNYEEMKG